MAYRVGGANAGRMPDGVTHFRFQREYYELGKRLTPSARRKLYAALLELFFDGAEPQLPHDASLIMEGLRARVMKARNNAAQAQVQTPAQAPVLAPVLAPVQAPAQTPVQTPVLSGENGPSPADIHSQPSKVPSNNPQTDMRYEKGEGRRESDLDVSSAAWRYVTPPTFEEVDLFCEEKVNEGAEGFAALYAAAPGGALMGWFEGMESRGWTMPDGQPVRDWRKALAAYARGIERRSGDA